MEAQKAGIFIAGCRFSDLVKAVVLCMWWGSSYFKVSLWYLGTLHDWPCCIDHWVLPSKAVVSLHLYNAIIFLLNYCICK